MKGEIMKKWYKSKLIQTGAIAVMAAVVASLQQGLDWRTTVLAGFGALVIVLRTITNEEVTK